MAAAAAAVVVVLPVLDFDDRTTDLMASGFSVLWVSLFET